MEDSMNVLVIGSGGREHALAMKLAQSPQVSHLFAAPGSDAIGRIATCVDLSVNDIEGLVLFAKKHDIGLTMVGPEDPLASGIVDRFRQEGLCIAGPTAAAARLESSKAFAKEAMKRYGVPTAAFEICTSAEQAHAAVKAIGLPVVIKADGLAAGKGVLICQTSEEAESAIAAMFAQKKFGAAGETVVVEQCLAGEEASFIALTDGKTLLPLASSQDHKRAYDDDQGPNTGGMGAYSPAPVVTPEMHARIMNDVMKPVVEGMEKDGCPFSGVLYAGVMIQNGVPYVLEFNCRFGDPETQPILSRLKSDLVPLLKATAEGELDAVEVEWDERPAVCVVMASGGYPEAYEKGHKINGLDEVSGEEDITVYHAGTKFSGDHWMNSGGRVLGVTALGADIRAAVKRAYWAVERISWKDVHYRRDIGKRALDRINI
jgi:phosphoribosylamine--glycine ligase